MELPEIIKASKDNDLKTLNQEIKKGADVNQTASNGSTALIYAAQHNNFDAVKMLIDSNADPGIENKVGGTALNRAAGNGNLEMIDYLLDNGASVGNVALITAAREGFFETVKRLVEAGGDINYKQRWGHTALMLSAREGHLEVVRYLIDQGANVKLRDKNGDTALDMAIDNDQSEIVNILCESGAEKNAKLFTRKFRLNDEEDDANERSTGKSSELDSLTKESNLYTNNHGSDSQSKK